LIPDLSVAWVIALVLTLSILLDRLLLRPLTGVMREREGAIRSARELAEASRTKAQVAADEFDARTRAARAEVYHQMDDKRRAALERRADLAAQLGAQATGERRLIELARRAPAGNGARGRDGSVLARAAEALMAHAEARVRAALARLLRGTFAFADALDDDGLGNGPIPIAVTLTLRGDSVRVDFTGSSAQTAGPVNAVEAVTRAATYYVVRCVLGELPVNDGTFRPIEVVAPAGTVVNPRPPAAVGAGNVETSQRIVDVVMGAFARALPDRIPAASYGTMSNLLIGGSDPRTGRAFTYYETLGGGHGAGPGWNGASALQGHMTNTRNTPIEVLEHAYPLRVRATRIRRGSGGDGATRGGEGIERVLELRAAARVTVISDRRVTRPYGLAGGAPGAAGVNTIAAAPAAPAGADARSGAAVTIMPGKFQIDLAERSVLTVASPGGGGFGRATTRRAKRPPRRGG
jgi:N-methylhydantoinase B